MVPRDVTRLPYPQGEHKYRDQVLQVEVGHKADDDLAL
jgi:hypothetical protein